MEYVVLDRDSDEFINIIELDPKKIKEFERKHPKNYLKTTQEFDKHFSDFLEDLEDDFEGEYC